MSSEKNTITKLFNNKFDLHEYIYFTQNIFKGRVIYERSLEFSSKVKEEFSSVVKSFLNLGRYTDSNRKSMILAVVELKKEDSIARSRAIQRNFVKDYFLKNGVEYALVVFYNGESEDWRLSFIKLDYSYKNSKLGEDIALAKRSSFLLGKNEKCCITIERFLPLILQNKETPTIDELEEVFSIETLTKEFLNKYCDLYLKVRNELDKQEEFLEVAKKTGIKSDEFVKNLMGQVVFLYFLQKKRNLEVEINLKGLFKEAESSNRNFFKDYLKPMSENYENADFAIDNSLFSNNKDGILDIFDRYAFTIKEDEPLEKEVAVDPEMLGKVFENLLDVTDRKKKGAFYTPREIVHYMCQESLINYLTNEINLSYDEAEELIRYGDIINDIDLSKNNISYNIRNKAKEIDIALENVKIIDPAVGSGAFPLGMVYEIVRARINLIYYITNDLKCEERSVYELKKKAIENSIYAVDIEKGAVDITKLRLWLTLVVEDNDFSNIKTLPNLDYNIMVGNSLIEDFLWKTNFVDVFREKGGFDIVIGNPPYIKIQNLPEYEAKVLKKNYKSAIGKFDIYVLFIEKAFSLINTKGIVSYIHPHRLLNADYGKGIRKFLLDNKGVKEIINFGTEQIFETATTYTGIFFYSNNNENISVSEATSRILFNKNNLLIDYDSLSEEQWIFKSKVESNLLKKLTNQTQSMQDIFEGIYQGVITVGDDIFVLEGKIENNIFKGYSKALDKNVIIESELMKQLLKGENIRRYKQPKSNYYIFYPHIIENGKTKPIKEEVLIKDYPLGYEYISNFKNELKEKKKKYKTNPEYWYSLHRAREKYIFESKKILTPQLQNYPNFCIDNYACYPDAGGYSLLKKENKIDLNVLLGIMNSSVLWYFIKNTSTPFNNNYYYFKTQYLEKFTFPDCLENNDVVNKIIDLVKQVLNINMVTDINILEDKIDYLVYELYSLTKEEIEIVENEKMIVRGIKNK